MFRNPAYLDVPLLRNLADYYGVDLPGEREVTRKSTRESSSRAGVTKVVDVGKEGTSGDEITESYSDKFRPVRALNDVVDRLLLDEALADLTQDPVHPVSRRSVVQFDGLLELSSLTEVAAMLTALMPALLNQASSGSESLEAPESILTEIFLGGPPTNVVHVFESEVGTYRFLVMVNPENLFGSRTIDDLDGEVTVLGTVDRVVPEGTSASLERYVMPNVSRSVRRAMAGDGLAEMLRGFGEAFGKPMDGSSLSVAGPAVLLTPVGIY